MRAILSSIKEDLKRAAPAFVFAALYCVLTQLLFHRICPFSLITGFPCPACGMSRSFVCLVTGRWHEARLYNIMVIPWVIWLISLFVTSYFLPRGKKMTEILLCMVCLATLAYYLFRVIYRFPSGPVMVRNEDNLLTLLLR